MNYNIDNPGERFKTLSCITAQTIYSFLRVKKKTHESNPVVSAKLISTDLKP